MSEIFHKSCYTSRSPGYKYRTLSTNTGERKRRDSNEDNTFDKKFRELQREITSRIDKQVDLTQDARESILEKFTKIDAKISFMLELQDTVTTLRKDLLNADYLLEKVLEKVHKIETAIAESEATSLTSKIACFRSAEPIAEEKELFSSKVAFI